MQAQKKPRADSKLKNLPEEAQEALWSLMHPTDREIPAATLEGAAVFCGLAAQWRWASAIYKSRRVS